MGLSYASHNNTSKLTAINRENLNKLSVGMTKAEVLSIMGSETKKLLEGTIVNSPYRAETIKDNAGNSLEIMFFYTDEKESLGVISDDELTPVILKDGKVDGWGRTFLSEIAPSYRYRDRYR
jgi:hypothetical protein